MGATKEKLREAEYFLAQMEEKRADRAPFKYSLSAFLSSARSVTWYAQKEFKRVRGFEEWYAKKLFLKARNMVIKQEHVPTRAHIKMTVTDTVGITDNVEPVKIRADGTREVQGVYATGQPQAPAEATEAKSETRVEWIWYFESLPAGIPEKDVVELCAEHVAKLRAFVEECEAATFSSS